MIVTLCFFMQWYPLVRWICILKLTFSLLLRCIDSCQSGRKDNLLEFRTKVQRPNFPFGGNLLCRFVIQIVGRIENYTRVRLVAIFTYKDPTKIWKPYKFWKYIFLHLYYRNRLENEIFRYQFDNMLYITKENSVFIFCMTFRKISFSVPEIGIGLCYELSFAKPA